MSVPNPDEPINYVLTFEHSDKSGFYVCGVTRHPIVARTWLAAADENNVYKIPSDTFLSPTTGWKKWNPDLEA